MARVALVLILLLIVAVIFLVIERKVIAPIQRDRHIKQLERENERLDNIIKISDRDKERNRWDG